MTNVTKVRVVTKFISKDNRSFFIVYDEKNKLYLSIENKYIGNDGQLTKPLTGIEMNASKTLNNCLKMTSITCERDKLILDGMEDILACLVASGIEIEQAKMLREKMERG